MMQALIFDFDGVVINSEPLHYQASITILKNIGITLTYETYVEQYLGLRDEEVFYKLLADYGRKLSSSEAQTLVQLKRQAYAQIIHQATTLPFMEGFAEVIKSAKEAQQRLAICSGSMKQEIITILEKYPGHNYHPYFEVIISTEDVTQGKPSPEGYLLTAAQLHVAPQDCLVIEDTPHGIAAAKAAGMTVVALTTSYASSHLHEADRIITKLTEL